MSGRLIVICGLPGSGKTTLARQIEAEYSAVRLSADDWMTALSINLHDETFRDRIEALQWDLAQQLLRQNMAVIIEWGSWARRERDVLRQGARDVGASVELHYLSSPVDVLVERIERRAMEDPPITRAMVEQWAAMIEKPTFQEFQLFDTYSTNEEGQTA